MAKIKCCQNCVPPKRKVGCHIDCPDYLIERASGDVYNDEKLQRTLMKEGLWWQRSSAVLKATKSKNIIRKYKYKYGR